VFLFLFRQKNRGFLYSFQPLTFIYILPILIITLIFFLLWALYLKRKIERKSKELEALNQKFSEYSLVDPLTKLYSHRYFIRHLRESINQAQRRGFSISILKLDIEHFKSINRIYGALEGDEVLRRFAYFLKARVRLSDTVARVGSDEFGLILNFTDKKESLILANRLLSSLSSCIFSHEKEINLRVSIGVVSFPEDSTSDITLLFLLDKCLERSKERGGEITTPQDLNGLGKEEISDFEPKDIDELKSKVSMLKVMLGKTILESITAFANTIRVKDSYTAEHTEKTVKIALAIGKKLGLKSRQLRNLRYAALLHDLGKVGIPERILRKPGKLTPEEFKEIKKHPLVGVEILRPIHELTEIIPAILYHHERFDGKGYPYGLEGNQIPVEARIVAIADSFQALTSNRPYRRAYSLSEAIKIIEEESGTHFDPEIVKVFQEVLYSLRWEYNHSNNLNNFKI
jgi:diguanylate cyclase (GGDEF)-like protein/putative nucleotidyltransferase with HDIG domain